MSAIDDFQRDGAQSFLTAYKFSTASLVFDVGGYEGKWTAELLATDQSACPTCGARQTPNVLIFEPVSEFYQTCVERFKDNGRIRVLPYGLYNRNSIAVMHKDGSASSMRLSGEGEQIRLRDIDDFVNQQGIQCIDLISINIEGGEYPLLHRIIETGLINHIRDLQVQFHDVIPNAVAERDAIRALLSRTHNCRWNYPFVWEAWRKKS